MSPSQCSNIPHLTARKVSRSLTQLLVTVTWRRVCMTWFSGSRAASERNVPRGRWGAGGEKQVAGRERTVIQTTAELKEQSHAGPASAGALTNLRRTWKHSKWKNDPEKVSPSSVDSGLHKSRETCSNQKLFQANGWKEVQEMHKYKE